MSERKKGSKWTYDEVVEYVNANSSSTLLDGEFFKKITPMRFLCSCGEIFIVDFHRFCSENKRQCNKCGRKKTGEQCKLTNKHIDDFLKEKN